MPTSRAQQAVILMQGRMGCGDTPEQAMEAVLEQFGGGESGGVSRARCACGALDSPNHRVMCWQARP